MSHLPALPRGRPVARSRATAALMAGLVAVLAFTALAGPAVAQDQTIEMRGVTQGGDYFFEQDGEKNPTLTVQAGSEVTINVAFVGTHNIHIGPPVDQATDIVTDESVSLTFTVPEDAPAEIAYWCDPHRELGMNGVIQVEGAAGGGGGASGGNASETGGEGGGDEGGADNASSAPVAEGEPQDADQATDEGPQQFTTGGLILAVVVIGLALLVGLLTARLGSGP